MSLVDAELSQRIGASGPREGQIGPDAFPSGGLVAAPPGAAESDSDVQSDDDHVYLHLRRFVSLLRT